MATGIIFLKGKTKWAKVRKPDEKYGNYEVPLYMDKKEMAKFKALGLGLTIRSDDDGEFVTFKRREQEPPRKNGEVITNGPPKVTILQDGQYVPWPEGLIGNGSEVTVKIEYYDTPRRGAGTRGHRLLAVGIDKLVEYIKTDENDASYPF